MATLEKVEKRLSEVETKVERHHKILFGDEDNIEDEGLVGFYNDIKRQYNGIKNLLWAVLTAVVISGILILVGLK